MKYLKLFEDFNFKNLFRTKKQKNREEATRSDQNLKIMIDSEPYDKSQFGQNKYGVYIKNNNIYYYIGDIREFTKAKGPTPYMSYLNIERYTKKQPTGTLCQPNDEQMRIIDEELNKNYLSPNLIY